MCISTSTTSTCSSGDNGSSNSISSTDLLQTVLLDNCEAMQPILTDDDGDEYDEGNGHHYAHSTTMPNKKKRPSLADCTGAEHWGKRRRWRRPTGGSTSSEESTLAMPEPDSTLMDSDSDEKGMEEEKNKAEGENFRLKMKAAVLKTKNTKANPASTDSQTNADQTQQIHRNKMPFSSALNMSQFEPWQITVTVKPDKRILEVRGIQEKHCSPTDPLDDSPFSEEEGEAAGDDDENGDKAGVLVKSYKRVEHVKHLKVPANVALEALSCTLNQNGWLRVEAPAREEAITSSSTATATSTSPAPDQSAQWTEERLIPVIPVIDRGQ